MQFYRTGKTAFSLHPEKITLLYFYRHGGKIF